LKLQATGDLVPVQLERCHEPPGVHPSPRRAAFRLRECFLNTTDPRGLFTGSGQSNWCGTRSIATLSADFTASALGVFAPAK
jgi:hypothetical protein